MENIEKIKCLIIGSGPAGYASAIYTSRADLKPVLYEGLQPGGQLTTTTEIENFPGFVDGITGPELMENMKKQAERLGAEIRFGYVSSVDFSQRPFKVVVDSSKEILAERVIVATGATAKWLGIASEEKYKGGGVSACATCDGFFYRGQDVAIVGGGDTAAEEATYLAKMCKQVYMIVRRDELRASKAMQYKVFNTPNIKVLFNHLTKEIIGDKFVEGVILNNKLTGEDVTIPITGFFVAIGHAPNTDIFKGQLELDDNGYIITKPGTTQTNIDGVFAAGDVQDHVYRQAVSAAGTGCMAAIELERSLM
ncbi:MAG: thioredoxin-disulfide reductase [Bacteroidetes bacterium GWF2_29_10]|nr:MAG: thioredoxin-disulfide reductase [Bacteroidetes bacterium GWF2_29_10]